LFTYLIKFVSIAVYFNFIEEKNEIFKLFRRNTYPACVPLHTSIFYANYIYLEDIMSIERKKTKQQISVMQAHVDGKKIECLDWDSGDSEFIVTDAPLWDWVMFEYRIKKNWHDNITKSGVLCWVSDVSISKCNNQGTIELIACVKENRFYGKKCSMWLYAVPLSKREIELYLSECPE